MAEPTKASQDIRPVYCRNCYIPMENLSKGPWDSYHWLCLRCGLEWKPPDDNPTPTDDIEEKKSKQPTKTFLTDRCRSIISAYKDGEALNDEDFKFVMGILANHPDSALKIGPGVALIRVQRNPQYPTTRGFFLTRTDGTKTDFSWVKSLSPPTHNQKVKEALRVLISPQILEFKQNFFDSHGGQAVCEIRQTPIYFIGSHVDHIPPKTFESIVEVFLSIRKLRLEEIKLKNEGMDNHFIRELADDKIAQDWIQFHKLNAELRVISAEANMIDVPREVALNKRKQ